MAEPNDRLQEILNAAHMARVMDRATELIATLLRSARDQDGAAGGQACLEMAQDIEVLSLVVGTLASAVVDSKAAGREVYNRPMATPEDLGYKRDQVKVDPWQIGMADQPAAAAEQHDFETFASLSLESNLRAMVADVKELRAQGRDLPTHRELIAPLKLLSPNDALILLSAALRELVKREMSG